MCYRYFNDIFKNQIKQILVFLLLPGAYSYYPQFQSPDFWALKPDAQNFCSYYPLKKHLLKLGKHPLKLGMAKISPEFCSYCLLGPQKKHPLKLGKHAQFPLKLGTSVPIDSGDGE